MLELGEVSKLTSQRVGDLQLPIYSITKYDGFVRSDEYFKKQVFSGDIKNYKLCEAGDFAYATIHLDEGSVGISPTACGISPMYTTFRITTGEVDPRYLLGYLKSNRALAQYAILGSGSAERRKSIKYGNLAKLKIPLPPLNEQKRIAEILGGAAKCMSTIHSEIQGIEALASSMISRYSDKSETVRLEELAVLSGGLSLGAHRKSKPITANYLRVANVFWGKISYDEIKELKCTEKELERTLLQDGDILITEAHANRLQVGRSAVVRNCPRKLVFQNHLFRARPLETINSDVLAAMLSSDIVRRQLYQRAKTTSGLNTIAISQVRSLDVPVPSKEEQVELYSCLQQLDHLRQLLHQKLTLLQELQRSLSARAFAGQL